MYKPILYHIAGGGVYACLLVICILALFYGFRARRNVKKEKITSLSRGFSPLDIHRIFIGKTYPRRLTRALIVHWAQLGYIRVKYVGRFKVKLVCRRIPPVHNDEKAVFFDRGTYVRERDIFCTLFARSGAEITVNLNKPLITSALAKTVNESYAAREDEGVYSAKHYKLKVLTFVLSFTPIVICSVYHCITGAFTMIIPPFTILIGMFVLRFIKNAPFFFQAFMELDMDRRGFSFDYRKLSRYVRPAFIGLRLDGHSLSRLFRFSKVRRPSREKQSFRLFRPCEFQKISSVFG